MTETKSKLTAEHRKRIAKAARRELVKRAEEFFEDFDDDLARKAKYPVADSENPGDPTWVEACSIAEKEHEKFLDYVRRFDRTP